MSAPFGQWQPIETAPKDGTKFLAYPVFGKPCEVHIVWWEKLVRVSGWRAMFGVWSPREPTHWMPLPAPPDVKLDAANEGTGLVGARETMAEIIADGWANDIPHASIIKRLIAAGHLK